MQMNTLLIASIAVFVVAIILAGLLIALPAPESSEPSLADRVLITTPRSGATVGATFDVTGSAPGPWYFEASFPLEVRDAQGVLVIRTFAQAQGEWMTTEDVPFRATVSVGDFKGPATLILKRDDPSGLPENDASVSVPIVVE
jgi:hypothetical protein